MNRIIEIEFDFNERTPAAGAMGGLEIDPTSVLLAEACSQRAAQKNISFGDAMHELRNERWNPNGIPDPVRCNETAGIKVDPASVAYALKCERYGKEHGMSFGEAMRELETQRRVREQINSLR